MTTFNKENKIITVVGLAGSGKTEAVNYITNKGYPRVYFGGVIYDAMNESGIEITPESQQKFREEIREKEGKDFVVKRVIKQTHDLISSGQHRIILDGLYSWTEYKILKHEFPGEVVTLAVVAPKHIRYHRLENRPERPFTFEESEERDRSEIENLEKGGPIAMANYFLTNDGTLEDLHHQIDKILEETKFYE